MQSIQLKKGKDRAVRQLHPWVFSGAIERILGRPENGEIVQVEDADSDFLAYGMFNGQSRVAIRLLEWMPEVLIDESWWRMRVQKAIKSREELLRSDHTTTCRLIFSEADYLPGLIVDRYGDYLSVQILSAGIEQVKDLLISELVSLLQPKGIFDRSDDHAREHEGLKPSQGKLYGIDPPEFVTVIERGLRYAVNIVDGQKSGFYCDQRDNRQLVAAHAKGQRVLDCFCYSGGFSLGALKNGAAEVVSVDSSALAIATLQQNIILNHLEKFPQLSIQSDVNKQLRVFAAAGEKFDLVILDPPKYAPSRSAVEKASRAYKDLNRLAMKILNDGGLLATFSCSGAVDIASFKQILAWAALDAGKEVQFIHQFSQPEDHPVRASFPEGEYLKGLLCRVY